MKGRLRNVKISDEQKKFASLMISDLQNLNQLASNYNKIILEFCSGTGDFLVNYAEVEPQSFFLGIDYAENAYLRALKKVYNKKLCNCKFMNIYIQEVLDYLEDQFFDIIYINFPDPWPKKRHANRRLVTDQFLYKINRLIKKDGYCIIITDNKWYQEFIDEQLIKLNCYSMFYENSWFTEDEKEFSSTFSFFQSNYYFKAKELNSKIRFYVLRKINICIQ